MRRQITDVRFPGTFEIGASPSGERFKTEYTGVLKASGCVELHECGKTDIQASINSHLDECDYHDILDRLRIGDYSALKKPAVGFGDFSNLPDNLADVADTSSKLLSVFQSLPAATRDHYDFSFSKFLKAMGTSTWLEDLGVKAPEEPDVSVEPSPKEANVIE